jgi:DUF4097 and DUF4098 domain-containing protein YvlB
MPTFDTPEPISVTLELSVGQVHLVAAERTDTVVEVKPSNESDESDVKAAQQVRVDYSSGTLLVTGPKSRGFDFSRKSRSVDVSIQLPAGSQISAVTQVADVRSTGPLGEFRFKSSVGNARLERTGPLHFHTSVGHLTAGTVNGNADISTSSGKVDIGEVEGTAVVKNSNGHTEIGSVTGEVRVRAANGGISVERAGAGVDAKSSNGSIRLGEVARGSVALATANGDLEIGIAEGTAAWLEVNTSFGQVRNLLEAASRPEASDETVEVHGRTSYGDITIRRASRRRVKTL